MKSERIGQNDSKGSAWLLAAYRLQWLDNSVAYESVYRLPQKLLNRVALSGPGASKSPGYKYRMVKKRRQLIKEGYEFDPKTREWLKG